MTLLEMSIAKWNKFNFCQLIVEKSYVRIRVMISRTVLKEIDSKMCARALMARILRSLFQNSFISNQNSFIYSFICCLGCSFLALCQLTRELGMSLVIFASRLRRPALKVSNLVALVVTASEIISTWLLPDILCK